MSPGKQLEAVILERLRVEEAAWRCSAGRYGVQSTFFKNQQTGQMEWRPIESYPDIEGAMPPDGKQFIFDCKFCGQASLQLTGGTGKPNQIKHLRKRSRVGVVTFYLIHWAERKLKTRSEPAETWAFPVVDDHPFWEAFDRAEVKAIRRDDCYSYGVKVEWNCLDGERKPRPDVLAAVLALEAIRELSK